MKPKRIFVLGWYGAKNIGDDLIGISIAKLLDDAIDSHVYFSSYNPVYTTNIFRQLKLSNAKGVRYLPWGGLGLLRALVSCSFYKSLFVFCRCDMFILGGGGFLSDWRGGKYGGWLFWLKAAKKLGKNTLCLGIGAGPFFQDTTRKQIGNSLNSFANNIFVRDVISKENLINCGILADDIEVIPDPVHYLLDIIPKQNIKTIKRKKIGINALNIFQDSPGLTKQLKKEWCDFLDFLVQEGDVHVFYMEKQDSEFVKSLNYPNINFIRYNNPLEFLKYLSEMSYCVGTRFHFILCCLLLEIPVLPIMYHHKHYCLVKSFSLLQYSLDLGDNSQWKEAMFLSKEAIKKWILLKRDKIDSINKVRARNADEIDKFRVLMTTLTLGQNK